jgi:hypothetical protein
MSEWSFPVPHEIPDMTVALPIFAIILSVASLTLSLLSYLRDRPGLRVSSEIFYYRRGPAADSQTPALRIRAANHGRRPAVLTSLVSRAGRLTWWQPLTEPKSPIPPPQTISEAIEAADEHFLAQNSAVRLTEGEVLDLLFWPDDAYRFVHLATDPAVTANRLYIEDSAGKTYRVRNDAKNLDVLFG